MQKLSGKWWSNGWSIVVSLSMKSQLNSFVIWSRSSTMSQLPHSGNIGCADILRHFKQFKSITAESFYFLFFFGIARSRFHLSFDLYTSPNYKALLPIMVHWTSLEIPSWSNITSVVIQELDVAVGRYFIAIQRSWSYDVDPVHLDATGWFCVLSFL